MMIQINPVLILYKLFNSTFASRQLPAENNLQPVTTHHRTSHQASGQMSNIEILADIMAEKQ